MDSQRENAIRKIINYLRNRMMAVSSKSMDEVLALAHEHDIRLEEVLKYWHEQALNV